MDAATGYKYDVFRTNVDEHHESMHENFLDTHPEIVEYRKWLEAAAWSTLRHYVDKELQVRFEDLDAD